MSRPRARDVGRHEGRDLALLELVQRLHALDLRAVAVDSLRGDAVPLYLARQPVRVALHAHEDQHLAHVPAADEMGQDERVARSGHQVDLMGYELCRSVARARLLS
jgi:hypothetical protein